MSKTSLLIAALVLMQAYTSVMLVQTRHELKTVTEDVTMHDEMLETVGDAVTVLENESR